MAIRVQKSVAIKPTARFELAGVVPIALDVPYYRQINDKWCWAACCEMLLGFFGQPDIAQCQMAGDKFGGDCCGQLTPCRCNTGCFPEEAYGTYGVEVGARQALDHQSDIDAELEAGRPIELYYLFSDIGAHVALVTARHEDGTYEVHDPYYGAGPRRFSQIANAYGRGRWTSSYVGITFSGPKG